MTFPRELKQQVLMAGRQMLADGLARRAQGNISLRGPDGLIAVSPSAISWDQLWVDDIAVVDLEGRQLEGNWQPTSELQLHLRFYRARADVAAVVHSHAPYATLFGVIDQPLPLLLTEAATCLDGPVPVAPYCRPGTMELAESAVRIADTCNALILANHGLVTLGASLDEAYATALAVEESARLAWMAAVVGAGIHPLDKKEAAALRSLHRQAYHPRQTGE